MLYSCDPTKLKGGSIQKLLPEETSHPDDSILVLCPFMQVLSQPNIRVACDSCDKNITLSTYIMVDNMDYCVKCFSNLNPFPDLYSVQNGLNYSLTEIDWLCID